MIDGVRVKQLAVNCDERGRLFEVLRRDDDLFAGFGQVYVTTAYPGVVKAWHMHRRQTDNMCVLRGHAKFVLYDSREASGTQGKIAELFPSQEQRLLIQIPPGIYHGFMNIGVEELWMLNIPDQTYDYSSPDEFRLPPDSKTIPYDWTRKDG